MSEYEKAKREYHRAGKKAKNTPKNSQARKNYVKAKRNYRDAGKRQKNN